MIKTASSPCLLRTYTEGVGMGLVWSRQGEGMEVIRN